MYPPAQHDEITGIANYIDVQLDAIRASIFGLTPQQARLTPCRSALSVAGIIKHVAAGMRNAAAQITGTRPEVEITEGSIDDYLAGFVLSESESVTELLTDFDSARKLLREAIVTTDPDAQVLAQPAPWHGIFDARPIRQRYYLMHQVEEFARHAGHADIIREQIDGLSVQTLVLTIEGAPANQFFTPYVPEPGTIVD